MCSSDSSLYYDAPWSQLHEYVLFTQWDARVIEQDCVKVGLGDPKKVYLSTFVPPAQTIIVQVPHL